MIELKVASKYWVTDDRWNENKWLGDRRIYRYNENNDTHTHYYLNEKKVVIRTNDAGVGID